MSADILTIFPKEQVLTIEDGQAYQDIIKRWADNAVKPAKLVILPTSAQDVSKAVCFVVYLDTTVEALTGLVGLYRFFSLLRITLNSLFEVGVIPPLVRRPPRVLLSISVK